MRSSNPDGAVYWVGRMLFAGEDPLYVARRMIMPLPYILVMLILALILANSVYEACQKIGMNICEVFLIQLAIYLSNAKKDNSAYMAELSVKEDIDKYGNLPVPLNIRNAETKLMRDIGYGKGYEYDHDLESKKSNQQCLPDKLKNRRYIK